VLSSEDFGCAAFHEAPFRRFVEGLRDCGYRTTFVVYLREQAAYAESLYMTLVRHGLAESFEHFCSAILDAGRFVWREWIFSFTYEDLLERLENMPHCTLIVRSYDRRTGPPLVREFLELLGVDAGQLGARYDVDENGRSPLHECLTSFLQNRFEVVLSPEHTEVVRQLVRSAAAPVRMGPSLRRQFRDRFHASNDRLFSRYDLPVWTDAVSAPASSSDGLFMEQLFVPSLGQSTTLEWRNLDQPGQGQMPAGRQSPINYD
jgi:hypothetical protein